MARRKQRKNGAGTAVLGFLCGSLLPPLGLGSVFAGYKPGTFWAGASWGGGISLGLGVLSLALRPKALPAAAQPAAQPASSNSATPQSP